MGGSGVDYTSRRTLGLDCFKNCLPCQPPSFLGFQLLLKDISHSSPTLNSSFLAGCRSCFLSLIALWSKSLSYHHPCTGPPLFYAYEVEVRCQPIEHILAILSSANLLLAFNVMANFSEWCFPSFHSANLILGSMFTKKKSVHSIAQEHFEAQPLENTSKNFIPLSWKLKQNKTK